MGCHQTDARWEEKHGCCGGGVGPHPRAFEDLANWAVSSLRAYARETARERISAPRAAKGGLGGDRGRERRLPVMSGNRRVRFCC